ncbi:NAD-dependent epimerase/dehydratase family protein [Nocardia sp. NPDC052001]|uniref:NAD-dependent epimerase/dehydratase family protein n=1 Tax=Nocardia sp. NPDC052001 TaxID=3154853 RepID=UPI003435E368
MAMKVLVLGGTTLIGPPLVAELLDDHAKVTIATRGITPDSFGDSVTRVRVERTARDSLRELAAMGPWDVIYDQICYTGAAADIACELFAGRVGRYILTSSIMVYAPAADRVERDFDPRAYRADSLLAQSSRPHLRYAEGKRAAEATFFQTAAFPIVAVRFPNILGSTDPSRRLDWHVHAVQSGRAVFVPDPAVRQSLVWAQDAGRFLGWLGTHHFTGPINAASSTPISVGDLLEVIATTVGSPVSYADAPTEQNYSPFGFSEDFTISTQVVRALGFEFTDLADWLPALIAEHAATGPRRSRDAELSAILGKIHRGDAPTTAEVNRLATRLEFLQQHRPH